MPLSLVRCTALCAEAAVLFQSALIFAAMAYDGIPLYADQLVIVMSLSWGMSLVLVATGNRFARLQWTVSLLKAGATAFALLTVPVVDSLVLPMLLSSTLMVALFGDYRRVLVFGAVWVAIVAAVIVFFRHGALRQVPPLELTLMISSLLIATGAAVGFRLLYAVWKTASAKNQRLSADIDRLMNVNVGFQAFAGSVEQKALQLERERLSREIHDSVGYSLTTLKMLFEAAKGLLTKEPERLPALMDDGIGLTRDCLEEVRAALRGLRLWEDKMPEGLRFVTRLVGNFQAVTGTKISIDFANTRLSYGPGIDTVLYKMVQECLTNAYRHGRASSIDMMLKEVDGRLKVAIFDDGTSSRHIVKGIGMAGMEERIGTVGGTVEFIPSEQGFEVRADIPVTDKEGAVP